MAAEIAGWAQKRHAGRDVRGLEDHFFSVRGMAHPEGTSMVKTTCAWCDSPAKCWRPDVRTQWAACRRCVNVHRLCQKLDTALEAQAYRNDPRPRDKIFQEAMAMMATAFKPGRERKLSDPVPNAEKFTYRWTAIDLGMGQRVTR